MYQGQALHGRTQRCEIHCCPNKSNCRSAVGSSFSVHKNPDRVPSRVAGPGSRSTEITRASVPACIGASSGSQRPCAGSCSAATNWLIGAMCGAMCWSRCSFTGTRCVVKFRFTPGRRNDRTPVTREDPVGTDRAGRTALHYAVIRDPVGSTTQRD